MCYPSNARSSVLSALVEGTAIRSVEHMTGIHRDTICRLVVSVGEKWQDLMDSIIRGVQTEFVQVDEVWCFVGKKDKRLNGNKRPDLGSQYVFIRLAWISHKKEEPRRPFSDKLFLINGLPEQRRPT